MSGQFLLLVLQDENPYVERLIRGDLNDTISEIAGSVVIEVQMVLYGEDTINGCGSGQKALRKLCDCRCGSQAAFHELLGRILRSERLRCMNIVIEC